MSTAPLDERYEAKPVPVVVEADDNKMTSLQLRCDQARTILENLTQEHKRLRGRLDLEGPSLPLQELSLLKAAIAQSDMKIEQQQREYEAINVDCQAMRSVMDKRVEVGTARNEFVIHDARSTQIGRELMKVRSQRDQLNLHEADLLKELNSVLKLRGEAMQKVTGLGGSI